MCQYVIQYQEDLMAFIEVPIRVDQGGRKPVYASALAAGCDLFATCDMVLRPGETRLMPLNLTIALPAGQEAQIRPRSGLSLKTDLRVPNAPGTIDADYRNPVGVILQNTFSAAQLPGLIASDPSLLIRICQTHRPVRLGTWLAACQPGLFDQLPLSAREEAGPDGALVPLLDTTLFLDEQGNPYGTIYIHQGDRIAQMVIADHHQAVFTDHAEPETIGEDRGGGFGSTGTGHLG
jgi:dUTP pyrophosphatase